MTFRLHENSFNMYICAYEAAPSSFSDDSGDNGDKGENKL